MKKKDKSKCESSSVGAIKGFSAPFGVGRRKEKEKSKQTIRRRKDF